MRGTAIRDFFVPEKVGISEPSNQAFTDPKVSDGIRNMILYNQPMTFPRAAALAAAKVSELLRSSGSLDQNSIINAAKAAITGSSDAATYRDNISFNWSALDSSSIFEQYVLTISYGNDSVNAILERSRTLVSLDVGYPMYPEFDPSVQEYTVEVPVGTSSIPVNYQLAYGATLESISGNTGLITGVNTVAVKVKNADNESITYTLTVIVRVPGDVNEDNIVDILDLLYMKKALLAAAPVDDLVLFDINHDGSVDQNDLSILQQHLLRINLLPTN
jgi:hypothetical protein